MTALVVPVSADNIIKRADGVYDLAASHFSHISPIFLDTVVEIRKCIARWFETYNEQELADAEFWLSTIGH
jgi:hypothetical protein